MMGQYSFTLRIISTIALSFFTWTFGGVFDIAYAVKESTQQSASNQQPTSNGNQQSNNNNQQNKQESRPEEKFGKDLGDIGDILKDDKSDQETRKGKIKSKRAAIDADDIEIRKQFSNTEDKIKDLPGVIKQRHKDFVKKYDDNLRELKTNLDDIDKAKTDKEKELAQTKAKAFFEKAKKPKKYIPLDPDNLPHRSAEPVKKEPRTKPEEFTEGKELNAKGMALAPTLAKGGEGGFSGQSAKPILVASNGSLSGLISKETASKALSDFPEGSYQLALATPPANADLAENIEVKFTDAIKAKAAELGHKPVQIYNWVRNNIEYVPTYGSIQGADMCLQTKQCNDFDTASLLIALLRASGIHAKYVYGTIELPIEKVQNWVGGFTDANSAVNFMASGGVPVTSVASGGKLSTVRMEHMWVEAWINYFPSRGSMHKTGKGDTWIRLDPSFKQYSYTQGIDIKSAVPFDAQTFIDQLKSSAMINETEGYVTGVNRLFIQQQMQTYQAQVQNYISQNYPNATVGDVMGKKEIIKKEYPYLLGTLPYKPIVIGAKYSTLPDTLRHRVSFSVTSDNIFYDPSPLAYGISLPAVAGKKITLSYAPATTGDEATINAYIPKPNADGTPIDPSKLPKSLPAYLINLKPELRVDGAVVATGGAIGMGEEEDFSIGLSSPSMSPLSIRNRVIAGEYNGVALDIARISADQMTALKSKLETTKVKLENNDFTGITKDDIMGDLLYTTVLSYFAELDVMDFMSSKNMGIAATRLPSAGRFFLGLNTTTLFDVIVSASAGGLTMDIGMIKNSSVALDGDYNKKIQFMMTSGTNSSALEHSVPEQLFSTPDSPAQGISAVKALQTANEQGIPIYTIDQTNIATVLPQLTIDGQAKNDIINAVNAGKVVTVSKTNITFNGWTGCGYIVINPNTGAGAYMISGGLSGGLLISLANFSAGFGDLLTSLFGLSYLLGIPSLTEYIRGLWINGFDLVDVVDKNTSCYQLGELAGAFWALVLGVLLVAGVYGYTSKIAIHGAHHSFEIVGRLAHIQIVIWQVGVKGSQIILRIPLLWR